MRFCPSCGEVVGRAVAMQHCSEAQHAKQRMDQSLFCVNCGKNLRQR